MKKIKTFFIKNKNLIFVLLLTSAFLLGLDLAIRNVMIHEVYNLKIYAKAPNLFTLASAIIIYLFLIILPKKGKIIFFNVVSIFYSILFVAEYLHYKILGRALAFEDIFLSGDAAGFVNFVFSKIDLYFVVVLLGLIIFIILINIILKKVNDNKLLSKMNLLALIIGILLFSFVEFLGYKTLGEADVDGGFMNSTNSRNIFNDYDESTKSLLVSGIYKFSERSVYLYVKNEYFGTSKKELKTEVKKYIKNNPYTHEDNEMTGIYKDKSVLYVLLESVDTYLITKKDTPTLYKMREEGFSFPKRYAPTFGGGYTFNTEFAMNTGFYQGLKGTASTKYVDNTFKYTFSNVFKEEGYSSISMHSNDSSLYNRGKMHKAFGFDKSYFDLMNKYKENFWYDSEVALKDETYNQLFPKEKFANFFITLSAHGPYDNSNAECEGLINKYSKYSKLKDKELACLKAGAAETDKFFEVVLKKLKKENRLDDVVFVLVTDHNAYGYKKTGIIKNTYNPNELNNVPFIIWNNEKSGKKIETYMDTADILPTITNMFGVSYNPEVSIGDDVFSDNHDNFVYFNDYSFIANGKHYQNISSSEDKKIQKYILKTKEKININSLVLDSDYYKK